MKSGRAENWFENFRWNYVRYDRDRKSFVGISVLNCCTVLYTENTISKLAKFCIFRNDL